MKSYVNVRYEVCQASEDVFLEGKDSLVTSMYAHEVPSDGWQTGH